MAVAMSLIKQLLASVVILACALLAWVYFFPSAIPVLEKYDLAYEPLKKVAAMRGEGQSAQVGPGGAGPRRRTRQALVITAPVKKATINDRLTAIGNGRAIQSVELTPLVTGQITDLPVKSGTRVSKGTIIAKLESATEEIIRDRARLAVEELRSKARRAEALRGRGTVSDVEVETITSALGTAQLVLREAELDVERHSIRSPINGVVGIVAANIGDYVTTQSPIVTIDNRSTIVVEYFVSERFAASFQEGAEVEAYLIARPSETFLGKVVAIDNRIDVASRTLRVRAEIDNASDRLRAGMAFKVTMRFPGETFPAVDPLAIQWNSRGSYVWKIDNEGKAQFVEARIVQRNADLVLVESELKPGDAVVTEGVQNVRSGAAVSIAGQERKKPANGRRKPPAGS